ncbi:cytochrome c3 family protein [Sphingomonas sp.]|uniref:cytochrome c3 family protein n=1 Tax=Sphingomonas sp. TaxID=28214 RepID=UPI003B00F530
MAQLFRPGANTLARLALLAIPGAPAAALLLMGATVRSGYVTGEGRVPNQPVPFSHQHHVGELGLDCRYCHTSVETAAWPGMPPTHTCMTCHSQLYTKEDMLAPVRQSYATGRPIQWKQITALPDYVYFDHHVHVNNGVPCAACHGNVASMPLMRQAKPLTMGWCLECHRDPAARVAPRDRVYDPEPYTPAKSAADAPELERVRAHVASVKGLTECSTCHR